MDNRPVNNSSPYNSRPQGYPPQPGATPQQYPGNNYGAPQGYPQTPQPYGPPPGHRVPYPQAKQTSGKAIASLVIGLVCVFFWPISILAGPVGMILGMKGMKESKQPGGQYQGYGLAMAGMIVSSLMFVVCLCIAVLFIVLFAFVEKHERSYQMQDSPYVQTSSSVDADLRVIEDQLYLYYIENNKSLGPGGPVVSVGSGGLYTEDHPRVEGSLKITDLVQDHHLDRMLSDYTLTVSNKNKAVIKARDGKREMTVDYTSSRSTKLRSTD